MHIPIIHPRPPSGDAQEVETKIAGLVRILREQNPDLRSEDIRTGLRFAEQKLRREIGELSVRPNWFLVVLVGFSVLVALYMLTQGSHLTMRIILIGVIVLLGVASLRYPKN